jgi:hypothetical protein
MHMKYIPIYSNIAHELKDIEMQTARIWAGYMIKLKIRDISVKSFHLNRCSSSCRNGVRSSNSRMRAVVSRVVCGLQFKWDFIYSFGTEPPTKRSI